MFFDFRKVFDPVSNEILLSKLHFYGIRDTALYWFTSNIRKRKQFTTVTVVRLECGELLMDEPLLSYFMSMTFQIPPLCLNTFYMRIIHSTLSVTAPPPLSASQIDALTGTINIELGNVSTQFELLLMKLRLNIWRFHKRKAIDVSIIKIGDITVKNTNHMKFLGILLENNLNFDEHVKYITSKLSRFLGLLASLDIIYHQIFWGHCICLVCCLT